MSRRVLHEVVAAKSSGTALADRGGPRRDQRAATTNHRALPKSRTWFPTVIIRVALKTLQFQRCKFNV